MAKKEQYYVLAEKYYVEDQMPVTGIAKKLNVTEKTLHNWRKEGEWDNKRAKFLRSQCQCYASLYELVNKMTQKIAEDFETTGEAPDGSTLYFIKAMVDKLPKLKQFENELVLDKTVNIHEKTDEDISTRIAELVDKKLMGE